MSGADVAAATNINPDFLVAIEEGRTTILPQAYVRAFLREFATVVGLDPQKVMEGYDTAKVLPALPAQIEKPRTTEPAPPPSDTPEPRRSTPAAIAAVVTVVLLGAILYWNLSPTPEQATEQTGSMIIDPAPETARPEQDKSVPPPADDSLHLGVSTTDTVWVQVIIDSRDSLDYILHPNAVRRWNAGESFRVSVGRPEAVKLTLNGAEMGSIGTNDRIIRNMTIDRNTLSRLRREKQP